MSELSQRDRYLIQQYLRDILTPQEDSEFHARMKDENFRDEFDHEKGILAVAQVKGRQRLRALLSDADRELDNSSPWKSSWKWMALGIILLAGLYVVVQKLAPAKLNNEELYIAHYEKFPNLIAPTLRSEEVPESFVQSVMKAYDQNNFHLALAMLDTTTQMNDRLMMYHAISLIETNQIDKAEQVLLTLSNNPAARYRQAAEWYLCLVRLKKDSSKFESLLNRIIENPDHKYHKKAKELEY